MVNDFSKPFSNVGLETIMLSPCRGQRAEELLRFCPIFLAMVRLGARGRDINRCRDVRRRSKEE